MNGAIAYKMSRLARAVHSHVELDFCMRCRRVGKLEQKLLGVFRLVTDNRVPSNGVPQPCTLAVIFFLGLFPTTDEMAEFIEKRVVGGG